MAVKIRLQRHGKKGKPIFHIVVADSKARRDGRTIDDLGIYNPVTNPATIELNVDKAVEWLEKGAQPSDTARAILSYKGALLKKHLLGGVKKGAFSLEDAEKKFQEWLEQKGKAVQGKVDGLQNLKDADKQSRLEAERKINEARIAAAQPVEEEVAPEAEATEAPAEATPETPVAEENSEETQA